MATPKDSSSSKENSAKLQPKSFLAPFLKNKRTSLVIAAVIIIILGLTFTLKSFFVTAIVNNQIITRYSLDRELEKQGGQKVLDNRVVEILIMQKAQKQGVTVTQGEIDSKINEIKKQVEAQGQNLDSLLAMQGQTKTDLEKQIKIQVLVEKLLGGDIKISDQEISDYFEKNKNFFPKNATLDSQKEQIKNELLQQKLNEKFQTWIQDLKKEAKIYYFLKF